MTASIKVELGPVQETLLIPLLARASWFRWRCDDPREIESWGVNLRLLSSETFFDAGRDGSVSV